MTKELTIALLAGLGGMIGWGLADLFAKKTIDEIGDITSLVWAHIFGTIVFVLFAVYMVVFHGQTIHLPHTAGTWVLLLFFGVLQGAVYLLVYRGFGKGQVAVLNPLFASFSGIVAIASIVVFGEVVSGHLVIGLILIFGGVLLLNTDRDALRTKKVRLALVPGFKEVALATLLAALWTLLWDKFVGGNDWLSFALIMYLVMTLAIILFAKKQKTNLTIRKPSVWKYLFLIGLCEVVAYSAISFGYDLTTKTSVVALLSGAFSLPTILLARVFLKEKISPIQTIGSIVIILGIVVLCLIH